jgi:uncharacterized protein HemX
MTGTSRHRSPSGDTGLRPVLSSESGASFVAVVMALALGAALYFAYFQTQGTISDQKVGIAAIDTSKSFACGTNRQTIERQLTSYLVEHDGDVPTLDGLDAALGPLPSCPEGGDYALSGHTVTCNKHR